jgi:hypothetical protein
MHGSSPPLVAPAPPHPFYNALVPSTLSNRAVYEIARAHSKLKLRSRLVISLIGCLAALVDAAKATSKPERSHTRSRRPSR